MRLANAIEYARTILAVEGDLSLEPAELVARLVKLEGLVIDDLAEDLEAAALASGRFVKLPNGQLMRAGDYLDPRKIIPRAEPIPC